MRISAFAFQVGFANIMPPESQKLFRAGLTVAAAALLVGGCSTPKAQTAGAPPPVPVSVAVATQESLPVEISAVGAVEPSETVQVKSQIAGELMTVRFVEGSDVNKNDLLFEIDPRSYRGGREGGGSRV